MRRLCVTVMVLGSIAIALIGVSIHRSREAEATVNGRRILKWLRTVRGPEVGAAAQAGTNAIPFLIRGARARDLIPYNWSAKAWHALPNALRVRVECPWPASQMRQNALLALRDFGAEAEPALPAVLEAATQDSDALNRSFALQAAVAIDANHPAVLALLQQRLRSPDAGAHASALAAIYTAGTFPRSLTNTIALDTGDTNHLFFNELVALGALQQEVGPFVPRILPFFADTSTRGNALAALRRAGTNGAAAVPALIHCLQDLEPRTTAVAAEALMEIGPAALEAVPALEAAMRRGDRVPRVISAAARRRITGDPVPSASVILAALQDEDDDSCWSLFPGDFGLQNYGFNSRMTVIWFTGELGPTAHEALPVLARMMEKGPDWQRVVAARSVWKVGGLPEPSLPVLQSCLASNDENVRTLACHIVGEIGSPAAGLLADLKKASRTTLRARRAALSAIKRIQPEAAEK
jgi:HEAT repeat protein